MTRDFSENLQSLRLALEQQRFPLRYCHKFIGNNTQAFKDAVAGLEARHPGAERRSARGNGSGEAEPRYLSLTYELTAQGPDEILELVRSTAALADLKIIL